jgi:(p)ppGpp synthase/HD superfamily hydrolase
MTVTNGVRPDLKAEIVAMAAHGAVGQRRKYTNAPYWVHCREVAGLVGEHVDDGLLVAAAWMHDTIEDTKLTAEDLSAMFPERTVLWVLEVTDVAKPIDGNREARSTINREHLARASPGGKTIKLADLISNTASIIEFDLAFAKVYLEEKRLLLPVLRGGNEALYNRAVDSLVRAETELMHRSLQRV